MRRFFDFSTGTPTATVTIPTTIPTTTIPTTPTIIPTIAIDDIETVETILPMKRIVIID